MLPARPSDETISSLREPAQAGRGHRGAEHPADRCRVEPAQHVARHRGSADPRDDLAARDKGEHELASARPGRLGDRDGGGRDHHTDVADRVGVGVVEVEPVAEHAVGERRRGRRGTGRCPDHARRPAPRRRDRAPGGRDPPCVRGEPRAEGIEQVQLGGLDRLGREIVVGEATRPLADRGGDRHRATPRRREHGGVARRVDDGVDQVRPLLVERGIERLREARPIAHATGGNADSSRDAREVRVAIAHGSLSPMPDGRLLDADQAERAVVEDHHRDREPQAGDRLELGHGHAEPAVPDEADDAATRARDRCRDRGRQRVAHRRETARDQRLARAVDLPERHGDEHVGTGVDRRDRAGGGTRTRRVDDVVRRERAGLDAHRLVVLQPEHP